MPAAAEEGEPEPLPGVVTPAAADVVVPPPPPDEGPAEAELDAPTPAPGAAPPLPPEAPPPEPDAEIDAVTLALAGAPPPPLPAVPASPARPAEPAAEVDVEDDGGFALPPELHAGRAVPVDDDGVDEGVEQELLDLWALAGEDDGFDDHDIDRDRWLRRRVVTPLSTRWSGLRRGERVNVVLYLLTGVSILAMALELLAGPDSLPTEVTTSPSGEAAGVPTTIRSVTTVTFSLPTTTDPPPVVTRAPVGPPTTEAPAEAPEPEPEPEPEPDEEPTTVPPTTVAPTTVPRTTVPGSPFPTPVPPVPPTFVGPTVPTITTPSIPSR